MSGAGISVGFDKVSNAMRNYKIPRGFAGLALGMALALLSAENAFAHCDGMDGPVVKAAQQALKTANVNLVLIWVPAADEAEIRQAFEKTLAVRKLSPESKELADRYFFETLVRIHRAGEGAPYTGLKPAGRDLGPAIPAADRAIEKGSAEPLLELLMRALRSGVRERFERVTAAKGFAPDEVKAGRE
ncbi:MAG: hypothetical protein HY236_05275, partial [Acidobacteria bacterium]|nr:hypothetical protein [Acidobacteriota bacterium]